MGIELVAKNAAGYTRDVTTAKNVTDQFRASLAKPITLELDGAKAKASAQSAASEIQKALAQSFKIGGSAGADIGKELSRSLTEAARTAAPAFSAVSKQITADMTASARTSASAFRVASDTIRQGFADAGKGLAPAFAQAATSASNFAAILSRNFTNAGNTLRTGLADIFANLNKGGGGANPFASLVSGAKSAFAEVKSVFRDIGGALGAEFAGVRAKAGQDLSRIFGPAITEVRAVAREYRSALGEVGTEIKGFATSARAAFTGFTAPIVREAREIAREYRSALGEVGAEIKGFANSARTAFAGFTAPIVREAREIAREYRAALGEVGTEIKGFATRFTTAASGIASSAAAQARAFAQPWIEAAQRVGTDLANIGRGIGQGAATIAGPFITAAKTVGSAFQSALAPLVGSLGATVGNVFSNIARSAQQLAGPLGKAATVLGTSFVNAANIANAALGKIATTLVSGVARAVSTASQALISGLVSAAQTAASAFASVSTAIATNLVSGIRAAAPAVASAMQAILAPLGPVFKAGGNLLVEGIKSGLAQLPAAAASAASAIQSYLKFSYKVDSSILGLGGGIIPDVQRVASGVVGIFRSAAQNIKSVFTTVFEEITTGLLRQIGSNIANALLNSFGNAFAFIRDQIGAAIAEANVFEQSVADITAFQIGASVNLDDALVASTLDETSETLRGIAVDPNLIVDLEQATSAAKALTKAGVGIGTKDQGNLLETVRLQNIAGDTGSTSEFRQAGEIVGRSLSQFVDAEGNAVTAEDVTQTVAASLLLSPIKDLNDLSYAYANAGVSARALQIPIQDIGAAITATSFAFKSGRTLGTALDSALSSLANPTEVQAEAFKKLGLNAFDAQGKFVGLEEVQRQVRKGLEGLSQQETLEVLRDGFGATGSDFVSALVNANGELGILIDQINNLDLQKALDIRTDTTANRLENLQGIIGAAQQEIAGPFAASLAKPFFALSNLIQDSIGDFSGLGDAIGSFTAPGIAAITSFVSRVDDLQKGTLNVGQAFRQAFSEVVFGRIQSFFNVDLGPLERARDLLIDLYTTVTGTISDPLSKLFGGEERDREANLRGATSAVFKSPILGGALGSLGIQEAEIQALIEPALGPISLSDGISETITDIGTALRLLATGIDVLGISLRTVNGEAGNIITDFFVGVGDTIGSIAEGLQGADATGLGEGVSDIFLSLRDLYKTLIDIGTANIGPVSENLSLLFSSALDFATDFVQGVDAQAISESLIEINASLFTFFTELIAGIDAPTLATAAGNFVGALGTAIGDAFNPSNVSDVTTAAAKFVVTIGDKLSEAFSSPEFGAGIGTAVGGLTRAVSGAIQAIFDYETYRDVAPDVVADAGEVLGGIGSALQTLSQNLGKAIGDSLVKDDIISAAQLATFEGKVQTAKETIFGKLEALFEFDTSSLTALDKITDVIGNFGDILRESRDLESGPISMIVGSITGIIDGISGAIAGIGSGGGESSDLSGVVELITSITDVVTLFQQLTTQPLGDIARSLSGFVQAIFTGITGALTAVPTEGGTDFTPVAAGAANIVNALTSRFADIIVAADLSGITGAFGTLISTIVSEIGASLSGEAPASTDPTALGVFASSVSSSLLETFTTIGSEIRDAVTNPEFIGGLLDAFSGIATLFVGGLALATSSLDFGDSESGIGTAASGFVTNLLSGIGESISSAFNSDGATALGQAGIDLASSLVGSIADAIANAPITEAAQAASAFLVKITQGFADLTNPAVEGEAGPSRFDTSGLGEAFGQLGTNIVDQLSAVLNDPQIADDLGTSFSNLLIGITKGLTSALEAVGGEDGLGTAFADFVGTFIDSAAEQLRSADYAVLAQALLEGIQKAINPVQDAVAGTVEQAVADATESIPLVGPFTAQTARIGQEFREREGRLPLPGELDQERADEAIATIGDAFNSFTAGMAEALLPALNVVTPAILNFSAGQAAQGSSVPLGLAPVAGNLFAGSGDPASSATEAVQIYENAVVQRYATIAEQATAATAALGTQPAAGGGAGGFGGTPDAAGGGRRGFGGATEGGDLSSLAAPWEAYTQRLLGFFQQGPPAEGDSQSFGVGTAGFAAQGSEEIGFATQGFTDTLLVAGETVTATAVTQQETAFAAAEAQTVANAATLLTAQGLNITAPAAFSAGTALLTLLGPIGAVASGLAAAAGAIANAVSALRAAAGAAASAASAARSAAASSSSATATRSTGVVPGTTRAQARALGGPISGAALVGEEGRELFYSAVSGTAGLVGVNGPEIRNFAGGTTIIPNSRTEQIMRRGVRSAAGGAGSLAAALAPLATTIGNIIRGIVAPKPIQGSLVRMSDPNNRVSLSDNLRSDGSENISELTKQAAEDQLAADQTAAEAAQQSAAAQVESANAVQASIAQIDEILKRSSVTAEDVEATASGEYKDKVDEFVRRLAAAANDGSFSETLEQAATALEAAGFTPETDPKALYEQFTKAWDDRTLFYAEENLKLLNTAALEGGGGETGAEGEGEGMGLGAADLAARAEVGKQNLAAFLGQYLDQQVAAVGEVFGGGGFGGEAGAEGEEGAGGGLGESLSAAGAGISESLSALSGPFESVAALINDSVIPGLSGIAERASAVSGAFDPLGAKVSDARGKVESFTSALKAGIEEIRKLLRGTGEAAATGDGAAAPAEGAPAEAAASALGGAARGRTLVGEEGPELWYNPQLRASGVVGRGGPQIVNFAAGTQVANASDTARIMARSGGSASPVFGSMASGTFTSFPAGTVLPGFKPLPSNFFGDSNNAGGGGLLVDKIGSSELSDTAARAAAQGRNVDGGNAAATIAEKLGENGQALPGIGSKEAIARQFAASARGQVTPSNTRVNVINNVKIDNSVNNSNNTDYGGLNMSSVRSSESVQNDFNTLRLLYG